MNYLLLLIGVFSCSTSVIFIKISSTDPVVLSGYRQVLGGLCLLPLFLKAVRLPQFPGMRNLLLRATPPGLLLGTHFITWIIGARLTPSANASLIVNMVPVVMPVLLLLILGERISRSESNGTLLAMTGVILLGAVDFHISKDHALGDAVCFLSMLFYSLYLVLARKNRDLSSIYLYVVPVYLIGGVFCLLIATLHQQTVGPLVWIGPDLSKELIAIFGLAIVPTVFGHSLINWSLRSIRGQSVAIINLSQFIFAGIMGFLILSELPHRIFYIASLLAVSGAITVVKGSKHA